MFHHLSAPSRATRQKVSAAEPWKAASPNWEPNTRTRSPRLTTWPFSGRSRASWRRPGWGLWGGDGLPGRTVKGRHVARTRNWWIFLFPRLEEFGNRNVNLWYCDKSVRAGETRCGLSLHWDWLSPGLLRVNLVSWPRKTRAKQAGVPGSQTHETVSPESKLRL